MIVDYFWYSPVVKKRGKTYLDSDETVKKMPVNIKEQLLQHPYCSQGCILAETKKSDLIAFLDNFLKIEKNEFDRTRHIEITEEEIDKYDYFLVGLRVLNWGEHITYEFNRPTCKTDACFWGAQITSPTRIKSEKIRSLSLAKIYDIWNFGVRFIISEKLKEIFDLKGITGLKYEPCLIEHKKDSKTEAQIFKDGFYVATIVSAVTQKADQIFIHSWCKKHSTIFSYDACNVTYEQGNLIKGDFQMVNRIIVRGKEYDYILPFWFVSRKVLNILLANKVADIRPIGLYFKKSFVPVVFD